MPSPIEKIAFTLRYLLSLFVQADYIALEKLSQGIRLTAVEMELAIKEYGATIVMPAHEAFRNLDVIEINETSPKSWSVSFDFWTEEEGLSDLCLELTLINSDEDLLDVEIDNIHVQ